MRIYCDGTSATGWGHVVRCMAVAEALDELAVRCEFAGCFSADVVRHLDRAGFAADNGAPARRRLAADAGPLPCLVDSYEVHATDVAEASARGCAVAVFDDVGRFREVPCRALISAPLVAAQFGPSHAGAKSFLGPSCMPFRRPLRNARSKQKDVAANRIVICLGSFDTQKIMPTVAGALIASGAGNPVTLVFASAKAAKNGEGVIRRLRAGSIECDVRVAEPHLGDVLLSAAMAVTGGGQTKYEAMFMGSATATISQSQIEAEDTKLCAAQGALWDCGLSCGDRNLVSDCLQSFFTRESLRADLVAASSRLFPSDPTPHLARGLAEALAV